MTEELHKPTDDKPEADEVLSPFPRKPNASTTESAPAESEEQAGTDGDSIDSEAPPEDAQPAEGEAALKDGLPNPDSEVCTEHHPRLRAPMIIASVVVLLAVAVALVWAGFFYKSLKGNWEFKVTVGEGDNAADYIYGLSFEDDHVCRYYAGGITYKGKYKVEKQDDKDVVTVTFTQLGSEIFHKSFTYESEGNFFHKRTLLVTDLDGMILPPDVLGEEVEAAVNMKKKLADSKEQDGKRYYIVPFRETNSLSPRTKAYENAKTDKELIGTWYEANENSGYGYTFTFREDGTYEILYSDISYSGCYTAENGTCSYNLLTIDGQELNNELSYSMKDDKLVLEVGGQESQLIRTDNQYAFEGAIK